MSSVSFAHLAGPFGNVEHIKAAHAKLDCSSMGRNLYILAATIGILALLSFALSFTNVAQVPGSPGDVRLWRTTSMALVFIGLVVALGGVLSQLFEQAERRATEQRRQRRHRRP